MKDYTRLYTALLLILFLLLSGCTKPGQAPVPPGPGSGTEPVGSAPEPAPEPVPQPPATVSLVFVGDIMLDRVPGAAIAAGADPFASFAGVLQGADLSIGNLECVIATGGQPVEKLYVFRCHPRNVPLLAAYFGALSLANNHSGDYGREAFAEQLELLEAGALPYFGGGRNLAEAHTPLIVERNGIRLALLGYNEVELESFAGTEQLPGHAWSHDDRVVADITAAREQADFVIVYPHWGREYQSEPSERQRELAHKMIDAGADLVVGGHPHVTQTVEYYRDKLIVYSLGNFVFDDFLDVPAELNEPSRLSWVLRVTTDGAGLLAWDTLVARTDDEGIPRPVKGAASPCKPEGAVEIRLCQQD